ncbi:ef hand family protein [Stylonychia lemnae]|uniref:Ef hand family protein n=1 Tax=Stylonychia lemnae TaxID=5949 RepID=A0A078A8F7_STYLE|nr:ef hand family protein [Stylonychia lemnae]|eukprot:CDW78545.1 ef hand family protein [Stylonychia lemnae]
MMRLETERMLATHLHSLAQHERLIENERIKLNEHFRFQPNAAFKRIDRFCNKKINTYDLATFLRDNSYNYYSVDLIDVIKSFDQSNNGFLEDTQLKSILASRTDKILARRSNERYEEYVGSRDRLALEVELSIAKILDLEIQGLKKLNLEKEQIKSRYDFSKLDAYRAIDTYKLNSILREDIKHFLNRNGIQASSLEADNIFSRIDMDQDGRITYTEFCNYLEKIPASVPNQLSQSMNSEQFTFNKGNQNLRSSSTHPHQDLNQSQQQNEVKKQNDGMKLKLQENYQTPQRANTKSNIQFEQNPRFAKTEKRQQKLNQQINASNDKSLEQERNPQEDEIRRNFIIYGVRQQHSTPLKRSSSAQSNIQLRIPVQNQQQQNKQSDKQQVLDKTDDKIASLETTPSPTKPMSRTNNEQIKMYSKSPAQTNNQRYMNLDDIEEEKENLDSFNDENNIRNSNANQLDQIKANKGDDEDANLEDNDEIVGRRAQSSNQNHYLEENEVENLAEALQNMIQLETEIEKQKQAISLKADFNLLDAFRLFDKTIAGEIFKQDLEEGFKKLGIYVMNKKDLDLFFKRYDKNGDYKLRYLEFTDAFTPKDKIYADHLANKRPNYEARHPDEAISLRTKLEFGDVIRSMLRFESNLEEIRINLTQSPQFSISAAFQTLDDGNKGFIVQRDVKNFLEDHEFFATQKEIDLLFNKIDKDNDGKISYGEFFTEIAQKLPY